MVRSYPARVTVGVMTRTGWAVAIALSGDVTAPRFLSRLEIELVPAHLPAQPYHEAAGLESGAARALVTQVEVAAEEAAAAGLRAVADGLPAPVSAVAVVVRQVSLPPDLADVIRSHARMHAAEGVMYREAMLVGARRCGWVAVAVDVQTLPVASHALTVIGHDAGRPWRRIEKDAARAALSQLPGAPGHGSGHAAASV
jgi:hypothetical protein